ncbi:MAG: pilus assembly protein [Deltaproteobacteria bacterium]|nr:pilus assembly protein [Deltaproteobacteria bacterium]MBI4224322.1 pilus assembly protein [Deltaproteobacteria bacterium]
MKNERGQVVVFFILLIPFFILLWVGTMEFSRLTATKMKLQGSLDRAVFKGAEYLTEALNQTAGENRKAHEIFLDTEKKFRELSKQNVPTAKNRIKETWRRQNNILEEKIIPVIEEAYTRAYRIVEEEVRKDFPKAKVLPFYYRSIEILDGRIEELPFGQIKGITFDPKGHRNVPKKDFEARMAFVKKTGPREKTALAAGVEVGLTQPLLSFLKPPPPFRAVAAAQPHGGSIWSYALTKENEHRYETIFVPLRTLPPEGFVHFWEDVSPYEIEH